MCSLDNPSISEACLMKYRGLGFAFFFSSNGTGGPVVFCVRAGKNRHCCFSLPQVYFVFSSTNQFSTTSLLLLVSYRVFDVVILCSLDALTCS